MIDNLNLIGTEMENLRTFPKNSEIAENGIEDTNTVVEEVSAEVVDDEICKQAVRLARQPLPLYMSAMIDLSVIYPEPVPILEINDKIIFSRGNISAIGGKAKSRKSFLTVLYTAEILKGIGKVVIVDTEMAIAHVCKTATRVHKIMGWVENQNNERLTVLSLSYIG